MFAVTVSRNLSIVSCCIFFIANTGGRTFVGTGQQFFRNSVSYTTQIGLPWDERENTNQVFISWASTVPVQSLWRGAGFAF